MINALTIDVEDYYQVSNFESKGHPAIVYIHPWEIDADQFTAIKEIL